VPELLLLADGPPELLVGVPQLAAGLAHQVTRADVDAAKLPVLQKGGGHDHAVVGVVQAVPGVELQRGLLPQIPHSRGHELVKNLHAVIFPDAAVLICTEELLIFVFPAVQLGHGPVLQDHRRTGQDVDLPY